MQEITRIHLATTPYNIELSAKKEVEAYLDAVKHALHADEDAMREIESRMSELLATRGIKPEGVVTLADVEAIKEQLGEPEVFAEEAVETDEPSTTKDARPAQKRRLLRDTQNAMLGGVCSGLAAYLGLDTVWVRLAFGILLLITSGAIIPMYILMWIIMPEAKTASDRLEMTGQPVTLSALKARAQAVNIEAKEPLLVKVFRVLFGIAFITAAVAAMIATVAVVGLVISHRSDVFITDNTSWLPLSLGLMAAAGTLLSVLLGLTGYVCFKKEASRNVIIALIVTTVLGITTFASGAVMMATRTAAYRDQLTSTESVVPVDTANSFTSDVNALKVRLNADYPADIVYEVSPEQPSAKLSYNQKIFSHPDLSFKREGTTLVVTGTLSSNQFCRDSFFVPCFGTAKLYLYGPSIANLDISNASVSYKATTQDSLEALVTNNASLKIASNGSIGQLHATVQNASSIDAADASIGNAELTANVHSSASFTSVESLALTASESCNVSDKFRTDIIVGTAKSITLNGKPWNEGMNTPCVTLSR